MPNFLTVEKHFSASPSTSFLLRALLSIVLTAFFGSVGSAEVRHLIMDPGLEQTREEFIFDLDEKGEPSKYQITGTRYGDPNGEPWLLCHGFMQTEYSMLEYVKGLVEEGKNVFVINEVGFGLEGRRSLVRPGVTYQKGDYGFKGVVQGISQAVANVSRLTGKPLVLMGFSMGAMASREHIEGTYDEGSNGSPLRSESLAVARQKRIKHTILIAGPPDNLSGMSAFFKLSSALGYVSSRSLTKQTTGFIPMGLGTSAEDLKTRSPVVKSVALLKSLGLSSVVRLLFRDGGDLRNYGSKEKIFDQILQYEFSNPHMDIFNSFTRKSVEVDRLPPRQGSRGRMKLTVVGAQSDGFVSKIEHMDELQSYFQNNAEQTRGIMVSEAGHLDLTGEVVIHKRGLLKLLLERNSHPENYDRLYGSYTILGKPGLILKYQVQNFKEELVKLKKQSQSQQLQPVSCEKAFAG